MTPQKHALSKAMAAQLKAERAARGFSQEALARRAGMAKNTIFRFETGQRSMDTDQLGDLCSALGMEIEVFLQRTVDRMNEDDPEETYLTTVSRPA